MCEKDFFWFFFAFFQGNMIFWNRGVDKFSITNFVHRLEFVKMRLKPVPCRGVVWCGVSGVPKCKSFFQFSVLNYVMLPALPWLQGPGNKVRRCII